MSLRLPWPNIRPTLPATSSNSPLAAGGSGSQRANAPSRSLAWLGFVVLALASCQSQADAPSVLKIGVLAPFEGTGRELGYVVLPAVKSELEAGNAAGSLKPYRVALVALNDDQDPDEAAEQAKVLAQDPDVLAVVGPWSEATARSAVPVLEKAGMPTLVAASYATAGATTRSICSPPERVAAEILRESQQLNGQAVVVTGPDNALRKALLERSPRLPLVSEAATHPCAAGSGANCLVIHTGDAAGAADTLVRWRAAGWGGRFVVGTDAVRPWFIPLAGAAGDGVRAVACGDTDPSRSDQDASLQTSAGVAVAATQSLLAALDRVIADGQRPTRGAVAEALLSRVPAQNTAWVEVNRGVWVPLRE
jgi:hypothetical protein